MKLNSLFLISSLFIFHTAQAGIFSHHAAKDDTTDTIKSNENDSKGVVDKKMDYKLSFKIPYYYNNNIPFWSTGGDVIGAHDRIRLSPSVPGTKGWIWSDLPNEYEEWMVDMTFIITGNQVHGGRGMALWYTKDKLPEGPIFGAKDQWDGLSIWFDSANPKTHSPTIMAFLNDGKFAFASAGVDPTKRALASCPMDYRNAQAPVRMRLSYKDHTLTLLLDTTSHGMNYRPCFQYSGITLPTGYHFGLSAASHNPADDHDIISFETYQLNPPAKLQHDKRPLEEEIIQKGNAFRELSEEQKKKIEEAEFEVKRLREQNEGNVMSETTATMGLLFDTERRILETLQISQLQLEALGAPTPEQVLSGDFVQKPVGGNVNERNQAARYDFGKRR
ncbi:legume-like lectin family-domain-containing protein [Halteromyces radiatus]|uniref:legume-like lectin family-domain-containing protein n=1 Tax=Halteromyces radiatus TaxID=101107 RepID=UPI00221F8CD6|nr:legume-like lectin family-domain-containing protein [Halteromyces radiatus]KAI8085158.1 legume-like lectin family-domain-containing protein [Halteromyces radiatus]